MSADTPIDNDSISRDRLALERTRLANERTLLAYARTSIMVAATGGTLLALYGDSGFSWYFGWILIALGVVVGLRGAIRYQRLAQALR